jgi:mono/diheme cytochrome c family protein
MQRPIDPRVMKQPDDTGIELPGRRRRAKSVALLSALVLAVCIAPALAREPAGKDLRVFYQQNCVSCHGPDGSAVSADGKKLRGQDFTDPNWQRGTPDDDMVETILKGKFFGLAMPGFKGTLTEDEVQRMVTDIIRKSKKGQVIAPDAERPGGK